VASVVVSLGILIRLLFLLLVAHQPLLQDAASYNRMAILVLKGTPFVPYWPPGLPLYLGVVHYLLGDSILQVRLAMLAFYVGTSVFTYRTAVLLTSDVAASNLALLFLALSPATIHFSVEPMTQLPAGMFLMMTAYCLLRAGSDPSFGNYLLLGFSAGYLTLIRPSSLVLLALIPPYLLWRSRKFAGAATVSLAGIVVVGAWIGYVHQKTGRFVKINTANARNLYIGNSPATPLYRTWWWASREQPNTALQSVQSPALDQVSLEDEFSAREAEYSRMAREYILQHPGLFLLRSLNRVCAYFAFDTFAGGYLIKNDVLPRLLGFAVLGLDAGLYLLIAVGSILYVGTLAGMNQRTLSACVLLAVALLYSFPYFLAFSHPRYHYPIEPILMILSSTFVVTFINGAYKVPWDTLMRRKSAIALVLGVFAFIQAEFFAMMANQL